MIKCNERQYLFTSDAITVQPGKEAKLDPFNTDWHTEYFKSCDPIQDGNFDSVCFVAVRMSFQVLYIAFADAAVRVDYMDALVSTFSRAYFLVQHKHYEQRFEWPMAFV